MAEDDKLGKLLDPALVNILGFLGSPVASVKTKTMGILSHLNKRIKANTAIPMPLPGLVRLFTNPSTAPLIANFALIYVEMGLPRISSTERAAILPSLLVGLARRPAAQQDTLLSLLLSALPAVSRAPPIFGAFAARCHPTRVCSLTDVRRPRWPRPYAAATAQDDG